MAIILNHTIVPSHDKEASARFFADIFGLKYEGMVGHFAPVRVNETLTLDFDDAQSFEAHHYAFHVSDEEFDEILSRVEKLSIVYGSDPWHLDDHQLNAWHGGRGFYFRDPNRHLLEVMTRVEGDPKR